MATVSGGGSTATMTGDLYVGRGGTGTLTVNGGGVVSSFNTRVGLDAGSNGTLTVDGTGTTLVAGNFIEVGSDVGSGSMMVSGGADVSANLFVALGEEAPAMGVATVTGTGSTLSTAGALQVAIDGAATLNVMAGGGVSANDAMIARDGGANGAVQVSGANSTLAATGVLTVGGQGTGTLAVGSSALATATTGMIGRDAGGSGTVNVAGGGATLNAGALYVGGSGTAAGGTGALIVGVGGSVNVAGTLKIWPGGTVTAVEGALNFDFSLLQMAGGSLTIPALDLTGRHLAGLGVVHANISGTGMITASGGDLTVGNPDSFAGFNFSGTVDCGANTLTLLSKGFINLGTLTTISGGTLAAPNGVFLGGGRVVVGSGALQGRVAALLGSTIEATGDLTIGSSTAFDGFFSDGLLNANNHAVTIHDRDRAVLGSLTTIGNSSGAGTLAAPNGFLLQDGRTVAGHGTVTGVFKNQGFVQGEGPNPADKIEFTSLVTGTGGFGGTVQFSGGYSPGSSPALVTAENVIFGAANVLTVELGGLTPGSQHDALDATGTVTLGGTLDVRFINGFAPVFGDAFTVLTFDAHSGDFADYLGLGLSGHLALKPLFAAASLTLKALPAIDGDINLDGTVNIFDVNAVSSNWGTAGPQGDVNGDGAVNIFDVNEISANWGATGGGGAAAVPEPTALTLLLAGLVGIALGHRCRLGHRTA